MMINNTQQKCQDICIFWLKKKKKDIHLNWNILFFNNAKKSSMGDKNLTAGRSAGVLLLITTDQDFIWEGFFAPTYLIVVIPWKSK